jgi:hypothetical protein
MIAAEGLDTPIFFLFTLGVTKRQENSICRFTNTIVKTVTRILNTWSLEARNPIAHHAKAKRYPN